MPNYSRQASMCRVDFFKPGGKWYTTEEFEWLHYDKSMHIVDAFIRSLQSKFNGRFEGMTAVCLEPYHELAHPIMLPEWNTHQPKPLQLL